MSIAARMKSTLDVISMLAVSIASGALIWVLLIEPRSGSVPELMEEVSGLSLDATHISNVAGTGEVTVIEFSDYLCPFCGQHARDTLPILKRELIDAGKIRYMVLHYPLEDIHPGAVRAAEAAECAAAQGRFWAMHERLLSSHVPATGLDFVQHAVALGLNHDRFEACMTANETLERIRADQEEGRRLGVRGTPTLFIGRTAANGRIELLRRIRGAVSVEILMKEIEAALST